MITTTAVFRATSDFEQVNTFDIATQDASSLARLNDGGHVVVWRSYTEDGSSLEVFGQRYDASGTRSGEQFMISAVSANTPDAIDVVALSNGGYVVRWIEDGEGVHLRSFGSDDTAGELVHLEDVRGATVTNDQGFTFYAAYERIEDGEQYQRVGRLFDISGTSVGEPIVFEDGSFGNVSAFDVGNGHFLTLWLVEETGAFGARSYELNGLLVDSTGEPAGGPIVIELDHAANDTSFLAMATTPGHFEIFWEDGSWPRTTHSQTFDLDGTVVGATSEIGIIATVHNAPYDQLIRLEDGLLVGSFEDLSFRYTNFVFNGQVLGLDGAVIAERTTTQLDAPLDDLIYLGNHRFLGSFGGSSSTIDDNVLMQNLELNFHFDGTGDADVIEGTIGPDILNGFDGHDRLLGGDENDTLNGGDGSDTLNGGDGDDVIIGGNSEADLRDIIYAGAGDDTVDGGYGNDLIYGMEGDDSITGGFGADELYGQDGNDIISGSALSDLIFGGAGDDFLNGGFGSDRLSGGAGADKFYHAGTEGHGSDWVQDYSAAEGDVLVFGDVSANQSQFQVNFAHAEAASGERSGDDAVMEAFVIYRPTGQIIWALVDGEAEAQINLLAGGEVFDLLA
ncbi:calcium-binding protein [Pseudooceanicola sp. 502str34]